MVRICSAMRRIGLPFRGKWLAEGRGLGADRRVLVCRQRGVAFPAVVCLMLLPTRSGSPSTTVPPRWLPPRTNRRPQPNVTDCAWARRRWSRRDLDAAAMLDLRPLAQTEEYNDDRKIFRAERRGHAARRATSPTWAAWVAASASWPGATARARRGPRQRRRRRWHGRHPGSGGDGSGFGDPRQRPSRGDAGPPWRHPRHANSP